MIDHVVLGDDTFVKYWKRNQQGRNGGYESWHHYQMRNLAAGYFIHNLVTSMGPKLAFEEGNDYFPKEGKELQCAYTVGLTQSGHRSRAPRRLAG